MIQYYLDLEKQVKAITDSGAVLGQIQKIYSTAFLVSFSIRSPGKTWFVYLGRGNGYEGMWLHNQPPISLLRRKDNFLEYLRKHVSSCAFLGVEMDRDDRIVAFRYGKYGNEQTLMFFWKARKLYFLHYFQEQPESTFKLLLSWHGKASTPTEPISSLYEYFDEVGRRPGIDHSVSSPHHLEIAQILEGEKKLALQSVALTGPGFLQRKVQNIEQDLEKAKQWGKLQEVLNRGDELEGVYELKVGDHKVKFEGELNPYEIRNLLFEKIKKLKRGESILAKRLTETRELLEGKEIITKEVSTIPIIKPVWGKDLLKAQASSVKSDQEEYRVFRFDDYSVGVGLSSQGNDQLRSRWATKDDTWLHLDGLKSAHVIIKLHGGSVSPEIMNLAATILAHFSHFNGEWIPVIFTPVKNLKGVTGAPGMVIYKKEKHLRCARVPNESWLKE
jgi:predicted ribosome quality control (RQC) complex YloA/Tae2 family protein